MWEVYQLSLFNCIQNAVKYSERDSLIKISLRVKKIYPEEESKGEI